MDPTLWYAIGGAVGSFLRALSTTSQSTWSRKTAVDVAVGGIVGMVYPLQPLIPFPQAATVLQQAGLVAFVAYASSDFITNMLGRLPGRKP